jgi:hypothetical protein
MAAQISALHRLIALVGGGGWQKVCNTTMAYNQGMVAKHRPCGFNRDDPFGIDTQVNSDWRLNGWFN